MLTNEQIAMVAHEANRAYCKALGDESQPCWDDAPKWQQDSAVNGVIFHALHPEATPEDSHESWMREKFEDGWEYGEVKDPQKKQHPCMLPYGELPTEQRTKDYLFRAVVRTLIEMRYEQTVAGADGRGRIGGRTMDHKRANEMLQRVTNNLADCMRRDLQTVWDSEKESYMTNFVGVFDDRGETNIFNDPRILESALRHHGAWHRMAAEDSGRLPSIRWKASVCLRSTEIDPNGLEGFAYHAKPTYALALALYRAVAGDPFGADFDLIKPYLD